MGLWVVWLVLGTCAPLSYPILPIGLSLIVGAAIGVTSCALMVIGLRRNRPVNLGAWLLIASGLFLWVAGDAVFIAESLLRTTPAYPTYADYVYLCAMPILALGLFRL